MHKQFIPAIFLTLVFTACNGDRQPGIWLIGDSSMAAKPMSMAPESGWGEGLKTWAYDAGAIHNEAVGGRSSKSYLAEGLWAAVLKSIQPGDYVIIQFGHNDERPDAKHHADPLAYKANIKKIIEETRSKSATPIVCSPIVRRHFNRAGELLDTHGPYLLAAREAAAEEHAVFIDLEAATRKLVTTLGQERSKELYMISQPHQWRNWPKGARDSAHVNEEGAIAFARLFVQDIQTQELPLGQFFQTGLAISN